MEQVRPGQFIPTGNIRWSGSRWYHQVLKLCGVAGVLVKLYDAPYSASYLMPWLEISHLIKLYGIWISTGIYSFARADDPARHHIKMAHEYPEAAGRRIYELEQELAIARRGGHGNITRPGDQSTEIQ